jgi:DNA-binding NtrC family response regulator
MESCVQLHQRLENQMERETVLYISDQTICSNAILAALNSGGYQVVSANQATQGLALLYILHSVAAVVLRVREPAGFLVRGIRAICPNVPIIFLCRGEVDHLPSPVDAYVSTEQPLAALAAVRRLVARKGATGCPRRCR